MREIKFRAWNEQYKKMILAKDLFLDAYYLSEHGCLVSEFLSKPGLIFMQYTGLKDKNGEEIYEGDIVKEHQLIDGNFVSEIIRIFQVIYQGVSFQYQPIPKRNYTVNPIGSEVEIIGNIYENPELLN